MPAPTSLQLDGSAPDTEPINDAVGRHDFEPLNVTLRSHEPRANIDPDRSKKWIRRCLPILLAHKLLFISSMLGALVALGSQIVMPRIMGAAIDHALTKKTVGIGVYASAILIIGTVRTVLTFAYRQGMYRMAWEIETDLRSLMYRHMSKLSFDFYDRVQSGQLISRANSDIRSMQLFLSFAPFLSLSVLSFVGAVAYMLSIHVGLTLVAVATVPVVYWAGVKLRDVSFPVSWIVQARMADITTVVDENITGVRVVRSFAAERSQISALAKAARKLRWATVIQNNSRAKYGPLMENLPRLGLAFVLLYGGHLAISGTVTIGQIVAFNTYVVMLQAPFRMLGFMLMMGQRAAASAERIYEVLDERPTILERPGAIDLVAPRGDITFENVTFSYPTTSEIPDKSDPDGEYDPAETDGAERHTTILRDFSLRISAGEFVAIVGRTGSGKSTIARLIPRFYDVQLGTVKFDNFDVRDLTLPSLRAAVNVVLDEAFLFSASIHDNIAYGRPSATRADVITAAMAAQADEFVINFPDGYDTVIGERGYTLSGGQRQRLSIARTLLLDPAVVVFDDSTSAIDVTVEARIHDAIKQLSANRTTVVIAHRLSTITMADRVVLLEDGRITADGTHAHLMEHVPAYREILTSSDAE